MKCLYGSLRTVCVLTLLLSTVCRAAVPFDSISGEWARETLQRLTVEEKIGQLLIPAVIINPDLNDPVIQAGLQRIDQTPVEVMINDYHVGGLLYLYKTTTPAGQIEFTRACQDKAAIPLLITQDLEWGLSMRLKDVIVFPHNMTLGAIQNDELIYAMGVEVGRECALLGVYANLAPVVDVNNNPNNPIINTRSFGENPEAVARKGELFMRGMQDSGVISCAKHFPGHGDTAVDSHHDLPLLTHSRERLEQVELVPFKRMIGAGVSSVMIGHLEVPALDATPHCPATLSYPIVTKLLQEQLQFKGLVITDALNMDGVLKYNNPGEAELKALQAGADILLCSKNNRAAIDAIKSALADGTWSYEELDKRVYKILCAKEWVREQGIVTAPISVIVQSLEQPAVFDLRQQLYDEALTVVKNNDNILPLVGDISVACLQIERPSKTPSRFVVTRSTEVTHFSLDVDVPLAVVDELVEKLMAYDVVAIGIHALNNDEHARYGLSDSTLHLIKTLLERNKKVATVLFGTPYALKFFENVPAVAVAYEDIPSAMWAAAQVLFGARPPHGKLPVSACAQYPAGLGLTW